MSLSLPLPYLMILFLYILFFPSYMSLTHPNSTSSTLNPIFPTTLTIPSFQEQSYVKGCPLSLSNELFNGIESACSSSKHGSNSKLDRSRCCPVLAAWLYSSYSSTALGNHSSSSSSSSRSSFDMPLVPDDSETCVDGLEKALKVSGIELIKPNESCDLVYCYCGIRLHPFNCPDAFSVTKSGELVGDRSVRRLEKNCLSKKKNGNGFQGLGGCSKCLNSLYLLNKKTSNLSIEEDRTTKIHNKDCELMGLTWLLSKNRTAYIHTVTNVLRALLLNKDGSKPQSCTLNSDGMPLAVDSSEFYDQSSSTKFHQTLSLSLLLLLCLVQYMHVIVLSS